MSNKPKNYKEETELKDKQKIKVMLKTLPSFVKGYIISIETTTTAKTRLEYLKDISNFFEYVENKKKSIITEKLLGELPKSFFDEYLHHLEYYEKNDKVYSNTEVSLKRKLSALTGLMTFLYEENLIDQNSITKVRTPKVRKKAIIRMNEEETENFLNIVETGGELTKQQEKYHKIQVTRDLAICYLLLSTGIRVSECVGLDIKDVNFKESSVHIFRKGNKEGYVFFSDEASAYLMEYYEERKRIETKEGHEQALFLSSRKQRITERSVENIIKKYAIKAVPTKNITVHKLRSTYASTLYEHTGDLYLVADNLGHENIETSKKYAELTDKRKSEHRNILQLRKNRQ